MKRKKLIAIIGVSVGRIVNPSAVALDAHIYAMTKLEGRMGNPSYILFLQR